MLSLRELPGRGVLEFKVMNGVTAIQDLKIGALKKIEAGFSVGWEYMWTVQIWVWQLERWTQAPFLLPFCSQHMTSVSLSGTSVLAPGILAAFQLVGWGTTIHSSPLPSVPVRAWAGVPAQHIAHMLLSRIGSHSCTQLDGRLLRNIWGKILKNTLTTLTHCFPPEAGTKSFVWSYLPLPGWNHAYHPS